MHYVNLLPAQNVTKLWRFHLGKQMMLKFSKSLGRKYIYEITCKYLFSNVYTTVFCKIKQ
jgi:hypothetical protein